MKVATVKLLFQFESLTAEGKQEFVQEVIHLLPPWDSGPLSDDITTAAGDRLAAMIDEEERASRTRRGPVVRLRHGRKRCGLAHFQRPAAVN
jgi:hypothetical protein